MYSKRMNAMQKKGIQNHWSSKRKEKGREKRVIFEQHVSVPCRPPLSPSARAKLG